MLSSSLKSLSNDHVSTPTQGVRSSVPEGDRIINRYGRLRFSRRKDTLRIDSATQPVCEHYTRRASRCPVSELYARVQTSNQSIQKRVSRLRESARIAEQQKAFVPYS